MIKKGDTFEYKVGERKSWRVLKIESGIVYFERANKTHKEILALTPYVRNRFIKKMKECFVLEKMQLVITDNL